MNFVIKTFLYTSLFFQSSFSQEFLFYKTQKFKNTVDFFEIERTFDEVATMVSFNKMDASLLVKIRKEAKQKGIERTQHMPEIAVIGNRIKIEGIKHPFVISNLETFLISYNGVNIKIKDPNDVIQTIADVEEFFTKNGSGNSGQFLFFKLLIGSSAEAYLFLPYLIGLLVAAFAGGTYWKWFNKSKEGLDDWPFETSSFGKKLDIICDGEDLSLICGKEKITFRKSESAGTIRVDYVNTKKAPLIGQLIYVDDFASMKSSGHFSNPFYSIQKKAVLYSMAKKVLGEDSKRKICHEGKFVDNLADVYRDIADQVSKFGQNKDKKEALRVLRQLDSTNQSR